MSEIKVNSIKGVSATSAAISINNTDGTCTANITNNLSNRNLVINGAMQVAQRGTSSSSFDFATVDRFRFLKRAQVDNLVITQSQSTDSPDEFASSYMADVTTAESALAADEYFYMSYKVEAQDLQHIKGEQLTLSFHVKAYQTGTYSVSIYQQDGNLLVSGTYTINSSATWEKKTITFPANSGTQPDNNNAQGFEISWILAAGSDYTSSNSTSWTSYSDGGYAYGQGVNVMSSTDNYWKITGVQLEVGSVATDFEHRSFGQELALCQRYYETHNSLTTAKTTDGSVTSYWSMITAQDSNQLVVSTGIVYKVPKRASPTVTLYNPSDTSTAARVNAQGTERTVSSSYGGPNALTRIYVAGASSGQYVTYNWEASAEL